jgi:hypothetical protein
MKETEQNILSIRLGTEHFKYAVFDPFQERLPETVVWKLNPIVSLTANLKMFFHQNEELEEYHKVNITVESGRYICVPSELYEEKDAEVLFYHNLPKRENEKILSRSMESIGMTILYGLDTNAYQMLLDIYPNANFLPHIYPLVEYFAAKSHQGNNKKMYVHMRNEALDVICMEHGKPLLVNSYYCRENNDRSYYLLYAWKQLNFDQERDDLSLIGNVPERNLLLAQLDQYIRHRYMLTQSVEDEIKIAWKCV